MEISFKFQFTDHIGAKEHEDSKLWLLRQQVVDMLTMPKKTEIPFNKHCYYYNINMKENRCVQSF